MLTMQTKHNLDQTTAKLVDKYHLTTEQTIQMNHLVYDFLGVYDQYALGKTVEQRQEVINVGAAAAELFMASMQCLKQEMEIK